MINVFSCYYQDRHPERQKEIDLCFYKNSINPHINFIVIDSQERLKFSDYFKMINHLTNDTDINVICNADIYFDETIKLAENMQPNEAYALSRWDVAKDGSVKLWDRGDSQDAWIWKGKINNVFGDFYLGWRGCDNRLAHEIGKAGYKITNPAKSIKNYHVHTTNIRNYSNKNNDHLVPGPYKTVSTSEL